MPGNCRKDNITLAFKKVKKEDAGTYRSVSPTSNPGKIIEQLILDVIIKQVDEKRVIRSRFSKGKSCLTHLNSLLQWHDRMGR